MPDPTADMRYSIPTQIKVFFRPISFVGIPPANEPKTVPHRAIDMMNTPWNQAEVSQSSLIGAFAPLITTVSNPNKKPARATVNDQFQVLFIQVMVNYP